MDSVTALLAASRGLRSALGRLAGMDDMTPAVASLDEIAIALTPIANLEAGDGDPVTSLDLGREALRRRMRDLSVLESYGEAAECGSSCAPACRCALRLLLLDDETLIRNLLRRSMLRQTSAQLAQIRSKLAGMGNLSIELGNAGGLFDFLQPPKPGEAGDLEDTSGDSDDH